MRIVASHAEGLKRTLRIAVTAQEFRERVEAKLGEIRQRIRLPGFRPGKVPMAIVRERYGASVTRDVVQRIMKESSEQARREHGLRPALDPTIEVVSSGEGGDLELSLTVEILPEIPPLDITALALERLTAEVSEEDLDRWLVAVPAPVEAEGGTASPGVQREAARDHLVREQARLARARFKRQLLDRLAEACEFPVPQGLVEREFEGIWRTVAAMREHEQRQSAAAAKSESDLKAEFRAIAERRVRLGLLLAEVGRRHGIEAAGDSSLFEDRVVDLIAARGRVFDRIVPLGDLLREADG